MGGAVQKGIQGDLIGSVRVLLVEDERASAMVIEQHLASIVSVRRCAELPGVLSCGPPT